MYYEINISLNGKHFFATAERSITDHEKFILVLRELKKAFPKKDGYEISASRYETTGTRIKIL